MRLTPIRLPFKSSGFLDIAAGDQRLRHDILDAAGKNHVRRAFHIGGDVADAAGDRHLGVAAKQRGSDDIRRGNKD